MALSNAETQLKLLYSKRDRIFSRVQRIFDESSRVADPSVREGFLDSLENIDCLRTDFENVLDRINTLELGIDPKYTINYEVMSSFDDLYCHVKRVAKTLMEPIGNHSESTIGNSSQMMRDRPRLPPIQIPEFDGDIRNWNMFFNSFENTVHQNDSLSNHEKLHYLVSKLTGKARSVLAGITLSAENYSLLVEVLKVKYEDRRLVATAYLDQLFELKSISFGNEHSLEKFLDIFASSVRAIKNLKIDNLMDFVFLYLGLKKLDSETVRLFELTQRGNELPSFEELENFIRDHIKVLQRTSPKQHGIVKRGSNLERRSDRTSHTQKWTHSYVNTTPITCPKLICALCSGPHDQLYKCDRYLKLTPHERYKYVRSNGLCLNCLSDKHRVSSCNSKHSCIKCAKRHHSSLHFDDGTGRGSRAIGSSIGNSRSPPSSTQLVPTLAHASNSIKAPSVNGVALCSLSSSLAPSTVLLATARVVVMDSYGRAQTARALIDSASQSNFITSRCCQRLGLEVSISSDGPTVKGIGGTTKAIQGMVNIRFYSRFNSNVSFDISSIVVDKVTEKLPTVSVDTSLLHSFNRLPLADDTYSIPGDIDILIGASLFPHLLLSHRVPGHPSLPAPLALETVLGYIIVGQAPALVNSCLSVSYCCAVEPLETVVHRFWEIEEVNVPPVLSPDDKIAEEIYCRTTFRDNDGRYIVALPFKGDMFSLGDSRKIAERRFFCLERKMQSSPKLKQAYDTVVKEYLDKGYISPVTDELSSSSPSYIIPHFGVIREDKVTTKCRLVLDGSAKTSSSTSLNDILYCGPNLQGKLFDIIVNFRLFAIALTADIRQMFLCIGVRESDRRFQRMLYRFTPQESLQVFEFNRVCFGLKSSPFHALRTIKQLANDEGASYPKAKTTIETGLYMDDFVYSLESEVEAIETSAQVIGLLKTAQFDLVKWISNSQQVLDSIPLSHRLSTVKDFDDNDSHKILGLTWSSTTDMFSLKINATPQSGTKRTILSSIARIWDVMGFIAPVVLYAKLLIKELWLSGCDWDDVPPSHITKLWDTFREELPMLNQIQIPRHVGIAQDSIITIIGFADASEKAYGGVVYFHVQNGNEIFVSLISAKSKVSPSKVVSLARLELSAMLLLVQIISSIVNSCRHRINANRIFAFSDSTVALCWAHSSPYRWDTFVANRVSKIQSELSPQNLYHVAGKENPADCLSRGLTPVQILDHPLWFCGPPWVKLPPEQWPVSTFDPASVSKPPEEKKHIFVSLAPAETSVILLLASRFSSWSKILRSVVYVCRFVKLLPVRAHITAADLDKAELVILRELQRSHFAVELSNLASSKPCSRSFQRLKPFLLDGLIRVGGRLSQSNLEFEQKHPIVLPQRDHVLDLLVDYYHRINCHAGPDLLMSILRQKYWIISARNLIRSRIYKCLPCFKLRPRAFAPEMADHRSCRVIETAKCFVHTGTDFCGPFRVTISRGRGIRSTKAYVCLFVCMTTRAVHMELASDLSTSSFMAAFKRFLSRRGPVGRMYSDNGTNYVGARRYLSELHVFLRSKHYSSEFSHTLAENRIEWYLNTPAASHFGGNWEANIKSFKSHLYRVIGEQILSFEEFSTVLAQIEAVMNTRPLCRTLSSDPSELLALTPAHFLNMTPLKYLPCRDICEETTHLLSRHDLLDKLVQSFWKRWRVDYLHTLQSRQKWNTPSNPIKVGTVVILNTENTPTLHWPLGIVEEVFPGSNGVVRIARVKTASGSYLRPVIRLCPLPN